MSTSTHWGIKNDYHEGEDFQAADFDNLASTADTQTTGTLEIHGAGVLEGWTVTDSGGLTVDIAAGAGNIYHTSLGHVFAKTYATEILSEGIEDETTNYLFVGLVIGESVEEPDTRRDALPQFLVGPGETMDGGLLLAEIVTAGGAITSITDRRTLLRIADLEERMTAAETDVEELQAIIELPYDPAVLGSIKDRLADLEAGEGGGGASYLSALPVSPVDPTDSKTYVDAGDAATLAEALAAIPGTSGAGTGTTVVSVWDEWIATTMQQGMMMVRLFPGTYSQFPWLRFVCADWQARGLPNYIHPASTMPYDTATGVFG